MADSIAVALGMKNYFPSTSAENLTIMNTLEIKGDWNIIKGKLKQKWAQLTDDDLDMADGMHDELIGRIQKRTGHSREVVEKAIKHAASTCGCD